MKKNSDENVKVSIKIEYTKTELPESKTILLIVIKSPCLILFFFFVGWGACGGWANMILYKIPCVPTLFPTKF